MRTLTGILVAAAVVGGSAGAAFAQMPDDIAAKVAALGRTVDPAATGKIYAPLQKTVPQPGVKVTRDIAYGPGPKDTLDVFTTEAKGAPKPILIFVHGGGFTGGDKSRAGNGDPSPFNDNIMLWAVSHGMVGVNMNYQVAPKATYPEVQHDIAEVVAWARRNAASFGGDPKKVILSGHSAGGAHVGSFLAHPEVYADVAGAKAPVAGAILISGLYTFSDGRSDVYYGHEPDLSAHASTAGLKASKTPMLVIAAELDPPAMVTEAKALDADLTQAGRGHRYLVAARHSHMSEIESINTADETLTGPMLAFIRENTR